MSFNDPISLYLLTTAVVAFLMLPLELIAGWLERKKG